MPTSYKVIIAIFAAGAVGCLPVWPYSRDWDYYLAFGLALILMIICAALFAPEV